MNESPDTDQRAALDLLELIPQIMQAIRKEMRSARSPELSVPQFRALAYLGRHEGTSLSGVAEHIGLMLPAASRIIDDLVMDKLATREVDPKDRRRIALKLTARGRRKLDAAGELARNAFERRMASLNPLQRKQLRSGIHVLQRIFAEDRDGATGGAA